MARVVLHLDMDAFYAAIEIREDPTLAGKPLIIGRRGRRGVVMTCSYEARRFGVRSALPSLIADRLCPQAIWLPGRMDHYVQVSRRIRALFTEITPVVEPLSIDEAYLDLTGIVLHLTAGEQVASELKQRIRTREGLTASVGVAPNKFLAKIASDLEKPDGLVVLSKDAVPERLWPLPIGRLWGVGPKTAARLARGGIETIGAVVACPEAELAELVGRRLALHLRALARGEDERPVESGRETKSISEERTYTDDLHDPAAIDQALVDRSEGVAAELLRSGLCARRVQIKVRAGDFTTWTRVHTLAVPTDQSAVILDTARRLFAERIRLDGRGVRLMGVGVSGLVPRDSVGMGESGGTAGTRPAQLSIFTSGDTPDDPA